MRFRSSTYDDSLPNLLSSSELPKSENVRVYKYFYAVLLAFFVLLEAPVEAYLDPGSGSMLLQALLGGFAGIAVITKLYWNRVTGLFNRKSAPKDSD